MWKTETNGKEQLLTVECISTYLHGTVSSFGRVEYTDCLGRTRKCLKKDLKECLARDKELAKSMAPREGQRREDLQGASSVHTVPLARPETLPSTSTDAQEEEDEDGEIVGPMPPAMSVLKHQLQLVQHYWD